MVKVLRVIDGRPAERGPGPARRRAQARRMAASDTISTRVGVQVLNRVEGGNPGRFDGMSLGAFLCVADRTPHWQIRVSDVYTSRVNEPASLAGSLLFSLPA